MKADLIDISVDDRGEDVEIKLSGSLGVFQLAAVREKIEMLTDGPGCFFFFNLQDAHFATCLRCSRKHGSAEIIFCYYL